MQIEDDAKKLRHLHTLLGEYRQYLYSREGQPLAAQTVALVNAWVEDNIKEVPNGNPTD